MAIDPIRTAAAAENGLLQGTLLEATIKRDIYVLDVGEAWNDFDQPSGELRLAIFDVAAGHLYTYDETDTTTADDGLTCRVDGSGHRYKLEDQATISLSSVLAVTATPPGSPTVGDAYICDTAATGAWSGHDKDIAVYTRRGWVFAVPETGMTVLDQDSGANLQFDANGDWVPFSVGQTDGSVLPVALVFPMGVSVEAQQNAPPSITIGPHYLVGAAGSGDWSGHNNALAFSRDGTTWEFIAAYEGATVFNKATDLQVRFNGSAWATVAGGIFDYQVFTTPGAATWNKPSGLPANAMVLIQAWGGGGGGSHGGANFGAGGGGGAYKEIWIRADDLGSSVSVNVAAGGAAGASSGAAGGNGGNSTFGSYLTAYGGGGATSGDSSNGGAGGGLTSAGSGSSAGGPSVTTLGGYSGGNFSVGGSNNGSTASMDAGAGGGGGSSGSAPGNGGSAFRGGAGGGGSNGGTGGTSVLGGNGGSVASPTGGARGGGGGGRTFPSGPGSAGAGGRGEVRVTVFA